MQVSFVYVEKGSEISRNITGVKWGTSRIEKQKPVVYDHTLSRMLGTELEAKRKWAKTITCPKQLKCPFLMVLGTMEHFVLPKRSDGYWFSLGGRDGRNPGALTIGLPRYRSSTTFMILKTKKEELLGLKWSMINWALKVNWDCV